MVIDQFVCSSCGKQYQPGQVKYTCPQDAGNLDVILDYEGLQNKLDPEVILRSNETSIWRYADLLPVQDPGFERTPLHQVGMTPIYESELLARELGIKKLFIKDESRNPSASFKDRASAVVMAHALQIHSKAVVAASTGNAGAATACMATCLGLSAIIIAPRSAPKAKIAQLLVYGAQVILVDGNYDQAFDLSIEASREFGWYNRNTGFNPFTVEGKKTAAFEIWEQLLVSRSNKNETFAIFIPVGDGNIITGIHKGFSDLLSLGWIDKIPRLVGVQAIGSAAIANAFSTGSDHIIPVNARTIADSIAVDLPRDGFRALRAVRQTGGTYITVDDHAILQAIKDLGRVGIFAEPAGATAFAGLKKACHEKLIPPDEQVIVINTGSGLKDINASLESLPFPPIIEPTINSLRKVIR